MRGLRRLIPTLLIATAVILPGSAGADGGRERAPDGDDAEWRGRPTYIGGESVLDRGEFIYSDYVHDDHGANTDGLYSGSLDPGNPITGIYPNLKDPANPRNGATANNIGSRLRFTGDYSYPTDASDAVSYADVADLIEFRVALDEDRLHYLVRLGALVDADDAVVGIGIDADRDHTTGMAEWPRGARLPARLGYEYFVTLWGTGGEITDGATTTPVAVAANTDRNFIEAAVPMPEGASLGVWRHYVGTGVWDGDSWLDVGPYTTWGGTPGALGVYPNVYDLGFVPFEWNSWWREDVQADDLAARDIAADHADIDLRDLRDERSGMRPQPTGLINFQYDALPLGPAEGNLGELSVFASTNYVYQGAVQPGMLFLPSDYHGRQDDERPRFMYFFHCLNCNHNIWPIGVEDASTRQRNHVIDGRLGTNSIQAIADEFDLAVAGSLQRGEGGPGDYGAAVGERDLLDVWNAIRDRDGYRFDDDRVIFAGMSMGGSTTKRMMTLYPDEIAAAVSYSSPGGTTRIENMRNVPFIAIQGDTGLDSTAATSGRAQAEALASMKYRHFSMEYIGRAHDFNLVYESWPIVKSLLSDDVRVKDPPRVTYRLDANTEAPELGITHDDAYWVSDVRPTAAAGVVDAVSWRKADELPAFTSHLQGHFVNPSTGNQAFVSWLEWDRDLTSAGLADFETGWEPAPDVSVTTTPITPPARAGENGFEATFTGIAGVTFDLERMAIEADEALAAAITTDVESAVTLLGDWDGPPTVTVDGAPAAASLHGGALTFIVPAGSHEIAVS